MPGIDKACGGIAPEHGALKSGHETRRPVERLSPGMDVLGQLGDFPGGGLDVAGYPNGVVVVAGPEFLRRHPRLFHAIEQCGRLFRARRQEGER
ncbi:MAG: hypothetical protein JSV86_17945 [Gemmatimonadota bacterium]|nr:MAG: hypothetical protein JSV86_17945 [Gemmatimonadota bacterium]